jgi:hypothetical protein
MTRKSTSRDYLLQAIEKLSDKTPEKAKPLLNDYEVTSIIQETINELVQAQKAFNNAEKQDNFTITNRAKGHLNHLKSEIIKPLAECFPDIWQTEFDAKQASINAAKAARKTQGTTGTSSCEIPMMGQDNANDDTGFTLGAGVTMYTPSPIVQTPSTTPDANPRRIE